MYWSLDSTVPSSDPLCTEVGVVSSNTECPRSYDPSDEMTELSETVDVGYVYDTTSYADLDTRTEGD